MQPPTTIFPKENKSRLKLENVTILSRYEVVILLSYVFPQAMREYIESRITTFNLLQKRRYNGGATAGPWGRFFNIFLTGQIVRKC